jgi:hypothetical protein
MIKIVKLKETEIILIKENSKSELVLKYIEGPQYEQKSNSWILILENNDIEIIADELFDIIQEKGITNGEINIFGKQVDDLVDKFNHYE